MRYKQISNISFSCSFSQTAAWLSIKISAFEFDYLLKHLYHIYWRVYFWYSPCKAVKYYISFSWRISVLSSKWTLFFSNMAELDACQVLNNCYIFNWTIHISLQEVPAIHPELIKPVKNVSSWENSQLIYYIIGLYDSVVSKKGKIQLLRTRFI